MYMLNKLLIMFFIVFSTISCAVKDNDAEKLKEIEDFNTKTTILFVDEECQKFPIFDGKTFGDLYSFVVNDVFVKYKQCYNINHTNLLILKKIKDGEVNKN